MHSIYNAEFVSNQHLILFRLLQWEALPELKATAGKLKNPDVVIPDYYYAPIHAYNDGNLCWESAMEEDLWSKLMIAPLYNNNLTIDI